ncbi:glutaminase A [Albimonas donghaensis]|nr:glutaminase A [Albimonas donghaensis]
MDGRDTPENAAATPSGATIEAWLDGLRGRLADDVRGAVADYIPELSRADADGLAICIATVDGQVYGVGDQAEPFTIQSVSKPFMYGYALREYGVDFTLGHVGVEPTGEAFNSIILDDVHNRPFNPMVNAGAIAVAELMKGATMAQRERNMRELFSQFAGRELSIDDSVYRSEHATGHRNRAIAYMMLNSGMIRRDPEDVLDLYFKQCAVSVTCRDLAVMAATLANDGANPLTGDKVLDPLAVRDVLTLMHSCGMYNYAGQWAYEVGVPAKSGVSGGVIAVIPGQLGIGVWSPRLDAHGNSVRGVEACKAVSSAFGLHVFNARPNVRAVIRREYRADKVASKRLRTPRERDLLAARGARVAVIEVQGELYFGSVERLLRRAAALAGETDRLILDFKRAQSADAAAIGLMRHMTEASTPGDASLILSHLTAEGPLAGLHAAMSEVSEALGTSRLALIEDADAALELSEDALLAAAPELRHGAKYALKELDLFQGLSEDDCRELEQIVQPMQFAAGETILRRGDPARALFVIARGSASVTVPREDGRVRRLACLGPGLSVGEMALLDGGARSADVVADEPVVAYALGVDRLRDLARTRPGILIAILENLSRELSSRLRLASDEIRALE